MSFEGRDYLELFVELHGERGRDGGLEIEQGEGECVDEGEREHETMEDGIGSDRKNSKSSLFSKLCTSSIFLVKIIFLFLFLFIIFIDFSAR